MTPNEITTVIASTLKQELNVPFRLQLMERVKVWRSRLIANSLQKVQQQRKFFRQTVYLPMVKANSVPCAVLVGCDVAITVDEIPELVRVGNQMFDFIGSVNGQVPFREITPGVHGYQTGRFTNMFVGYELINKKIVANHPELPYVRIDAVFDDPMAVMEFNCKCGPNVVDDCDSWNKEFPMSGDIAQLVIQSILTVDYNRAVQQDTIEVPVTEGKNG